MFWSKWVNMTFQVVDFGLVTTKLKLNTEGEGSVPETRGSILRTRDSDEGSCFALGSPAGDSVPGVE